MKPGDTKDSGFTLAELLVVIVIIGILAALILPTLTSAQCQAKEGTTKNKIRNIKSALETYKMDHGRYPPETSEAGSEPLYENLSKKKGRGQVYFEFDDKFVKSLEENSQRKKVYSQFGFHEAHEIHYALPRGENYENMWKYDGENPSPDQLNLNEVNLWTAGCSFSPEKGNKETHYEINNFE